VATPTADHEVVTAHVPGSHIGDPAPLGLAGFAMTTFFLNLVNVGWLNASVGGVVLGLAIFYGGLGQLIAGLWEFAKGNSFGGVAFCSYGGFWLSFWYLQVHTDLSKASPHQAAAGVGWYLLGWAIFTAYMTVASLNTNYVLTAVFVALTLTFVFLGVGAINMDAAGHGATEVGGYIGLVTALLAWYASMAGVYNATAKRAVMPMLTH
jgi:succinate-acetate transporter protein